MDFMSSEDSSEGEDSGLPPGEWNRLADMARTDVHGKVLVDEKVLEVKTPRWRSEEVSDQCHDEASLTLLTGQNGLTAPIAV